MNLRRTFTACAMLVAVLAPHAHANESAELNQALSLCRSEECKQLLLLGKIKPGPSIVCLNRLQAPTARRYTPQEARSEFFSCYEREQQKRHSMLK